MASFLINTAEPMVKMRVVTVRDDSERTLKTLQNIGVLDVEESVELNPVDKTAIEKAHREVNELTSYITKILSYLPERDTVTLDEDIEVIYTEPFGEITDEVKRIYNKTSRLQERIQEITEKLLHMNEITTYLEPLAENSYLSIRDLNYSGKHLISRIIVIPTESVDYLRNSLAEFITENIVVTAGNDTVIHAIGDTRNNDKIQSVISGSGGKILDIPSDAISVNEYLEKSDREMTEYEQEKEKLTGELIGQIDTDLKRLVLLREALTAENERLSVLEKASEAKYITVIEGWLPKNAVENTFVEIKEKIPYVFVDAREPEASEEPPTKYRNPEGFKPFQIIVNLFATPKYREWDPTPVITYSFAFFFGLMICDVLYAIGLMLLGRFLLSKFVDDPSAETFKQFQRLLYICGGVALVGGLLTGQYFGNIYEFIGIENLALVKSVQEALQDPVMFIGIALGIGFIHVNIGHIIAFAKAIKERNKGNVIAKIGLAMIQLGIPTILNSLMGVDIPGFTPAIYSILSYFLIGGIVLVIISSIMVSGGLGAILWLFDITGLLGDIMSYARLAGVGLATYYLAFTFNQMATIFTEMMNSGLAAVFGIILAVVIVIFGHVINLVLTAITGFMHSLRLCFVEFLFKFYDGGGTEYNPFRLIKRTTVPV
ncbi:V-type ATP synthase subunit I [Chloroflexota bacterium]